MARPERLPYGVQLGVESEDEPQTTEASDLPEMVIGWVLAAVEHSIRHGDYRVSVPQLVRIGKAGYQWASEKH